jgi:hypothetical protein
MEDGRQTEELEINWNGQKAKVTVQQLLDGDYQDILAASMVTKVKDGQVLVDIDPIRQRQLRIIKGIAKAPFSPVNGDACRQLTVPDANKIDAAVQRLTGLNEEQKKDSEASSQGPATS